MKLYTPLRTIPVSAAATEVFVVDCVFASSFNWTTYILSLGYKLAIDQ